MTDLKTTTILRRAAGVRLLIGADDQVRVHVGEQERDCGAHALAILDVFSRPRPLAEALDELRPRLTGMADWVDLMASLERLYRLGALVDQAGAPAPTAEKARGVGALGLHVALLNDRRRTGAYLEAIAEVVKPGDVVVDLGSGTGILALAAARAGAAHVYAIESTAIGQVAQALFEANGLGDLITLLSGWSTRQALPRPADVLISEIIGNDPFAERILEFTRDAVRRMLRPGARLVPSRLRVYGVPVSIPPDQRARHTVTAEDAARWEQWYGLDFAPWYRQMLGTPYSVAVRPAKAKEWTALGEPVLLADVDLSAAFELFVDATAQVTTQRAGRLDGLLIYFEAWLTESRVLSTAPANADEDSSWMNPVWLMNEGLTLDASERVRVTYRYGTGTAEHEVRIERA